MRNKLYRSRDRVFAGVCGGIAEWLGLSTGLVRFLTVIFFFFSAGIPVGTIYILMAIFIPKEPYREYREYREWR
ncbi:MAG: PspC domain-containing protein [Spirochaetales bacterium]|nr:PspC domain-containing protein [Spirochaetales bacterium]